jgi:hypothetical protein
MGTKARSEGAGGQGEYTSCSCSIALYNSPAVIALDLGGIIWEERLLGGEELTPERRIDERRFGILVGEEDGPSAILFEGADGVASKAWGLRRSLEGKRRMRIVGRGVKWLAAYACLDGVGAGGWWGGDSRFHTDLV